MSDWKQMPYFLAVARCGSLRGAAEQLGATHATVRHHIQALEHSYGVQLFRRSRAGLHLTPAGETLMPDAQQAETLLSKARNGLQGLDNEAAGLIRISMDPMTGHYLMAPILAEFCRFYPDIELEIRLTYDIEDINKLETDVSIRHAPSLEDDVIARKLFPFSIGVYASRDYVDTILPTAQDKGKNLTWIGYGMVEEMQAWIAKSPFQNARIRHQVMDPEMHLHLVRNGAGMSFLPLWAERQFPELQRVPGTQIDQSRSTWLLLHADLKHTTRVRVFVDYVSQALIHMRSDIRGP